MWKYCEICCISITIYIKERKVQTEDWKKNKNVATIAIMQLGTVTTVQKKKDKVANQNGTVDEQWKTLYEQYKNTVEKRTQINDWEKIKIKNKK